MVKIPRKEDLKLILGRIVAKIPHGGKGERNRAAQTGSLCKSSKRPNN